MSNVINLDSRRKVPSEFQQRAMIKEFAIQELMRAYQHIPLIDLQLAIHKAVKAIDDGSGFDEAYMIASRYVNKTLELNPGATWTTTTTK